MFCKDYPCMKNDGNDTVSMVRYEKCKMWLHCHYIGIISSEKFSNDASIRPNKEDYWCMSEVHPHKLQ